MEDNTSKKYEKLAKKIIRLDFFRQKDKAISLLTKEMQEGQYTIYEKSSGLIY